MKRIEFKQWTELRTWIDEDRQLLPVYWRGQKDPGWPLASSFEREILSMSGGSRPGASQIYPYDDRYERDGRPIWSPGFYQEMRNRYLEAFQRATAGLRGPNPASLRRDQWWALGRHYGLITPLLDWTESPYMASFFALSELLAEMRTSSGIAYTTSRRIAIYRLFHSEQLEGDGLSVVRPILDELSRMHGQRGLFSWLNSERFFELEGFMDNTGRGDLLTQVLISGQAVMDGLRDLKRHGIDYRLLFPDLFGAAKHANTMWDMVP